MALILNKELPTGLVVEEAYAKIDTINCRKHDMEIIVSYYLNKDIRFENKSPLFVNSIFSIANISESDTNIFKFAYAQLKKTDEFKDAIDDLEI